jgi:alpha/beta superfamily hydrolase
MNDCPLENFQAQARIPVGNKSRPSPNPTGAYGSCAGQPRFTMLSGWLMVLLSTTMGLEEVRGTDFVMKDEPDLERSVCGLHREPFAFWSFRRAAGAPDAKRVRSIPDSEHLSFRTRDGRSLGGYKLRAVKPWGYLLVAQGNAMLADHILGELQFFRGFGLDVYLYDYRGYGLSDAKSRLKALVSDYHEIVRALNAQEYRRHFLYGISMGGIVLLDAVGKTREYDAVVIDSAPSRISPFGCPEEYDPIHHLPTDCSRIKIIIGLRDRVVLPEDSQDLASMAEGRGAEVLREPEFAHPFQDPSLETHRRRLHDIADFLTRWRP